MGETHIGIDPVTNRRVRLMRSQYGEVQLDVSSPDQASTINMYLKDRLGLTPPFRYLDAGHGNGETVRRLRQEHGIEAFGVDKDPSDLVARDGKIFFTEDLRRRTHFDDNFFTVVAEQLLFDQVQYIEKRPDDIFPIVNEIRRILQPGGFYVSVTGATPPMSVLEQAGFSLYGYSAGDVKRAFQLQK